MIFKKKHYVHLFDFPGEVYLFEHDTDEFLSVLSMLGFNASHDGSNLHVEEIDPFEDDLLETEMDSVQNEDLTSDYDYEEPQSKRIKVNFKPVLKMDNGGWDSTSVDLRNNDTTLTKENISFFREKLRHNLLHHIKAKGEDTTYMNPNVKVWYSQDPFALKATYECPVCQKSSSLTATLDKDKKKFAFWDMSNYRKHIKRHRLQNTTDNTMEIEHLNVDIPNEETSEDTNQYDTFDLTLTESSFNQFDMEKSPHNKIIPENLGYFKARLIQCIRTVLNRTDIKHSKRIRSHKFSVTIQGNPPKLKGLYQCFLCQKSLTVPYNIHENGHLKQWCPNNLKRHFDKMHQ